MVRVRLDLVLGLCPALCGGGAPSFDGGDGDGDGDGVQAADVMHDGGVAVSTGMRIGFRRLALTRKSVGQSGGGLVVVSSHSIPSSCCI